MTTQVKICGLKTPDAMMAALEAADFVGLVFHPPSPRHVDIEVASYLSSYVPDRVMICGLFVDPDDQKLDKILSNVRIDMIQLHGNETPDRVAAIKQATGKRVMKALSIENAASLSQIPAYEAVADWLLLDAKGTDTMPGGGGIAFDWSLLDSFRPSRPWMLAGGLTPENVGSAIRRLKPTAVDVSSGVESSRGVKVPDKIRLFLDSAKSA